MTPVQIETADKVIIKSDGAEVDLPGGRTAVVKSSPKGGIVSEIRQHSVFADYHLDVDAPDCQKVTIDEVVFRAQEERQPKK